MSPDHWSKLTWDTVSAGGYDLFGSNRLLGPETRPCVQTESHSYSRDLTGVAVYLDDILISGTTAEDHPNNLQQLLKRLNDKGLRCRIEKCDFAEDTVTYLGHTISRNGIAKSPKANAVTKMPVPSNVTQLRSFLGLVQFYNKSLPDLSTISGPLYHLTEKNTK